MEYEAADLFRALQSGHNFEWIASAHVKVPLWRQCGFQNATSFRRFRFVFRRTAATCSLLLYQFLRDPVGRTSRSLKVRNCATPSPRARPTSLEEHRWRRSLRHKMERIILQPRTDRPSWWPHRAGCLQFRCSLATARFRTVKRVRKALLSHTAHLEPRYVIEFRSSSGGAQLRINAQVLGRAFRSFKII